MDDSIPDQIGDARDAPAQQPNPPAQVNSGTAINKQANNEGRKYKLRRKLQGAHKWVEASCAILLVIITWRYTNFAGGQVKAMQDQLVQMQQSGTQTDQLIGLYRQQVSKLGEQISKLDQSIGATNRLEGQARRSANIAERTFVAANRPYIGIEYIGVGFAKEDGTLQIKPTKETSVLGVRVEIKNFGPVPGTSYTGDWKVWVGGRKRPGTKVPDRPFTMFPTESLSLQGAIPNPEYREIMSGAKKLIIEVETSYNGPSGHYEQCEKHQFGPDNLAFMNLGACTHDGK